MSEDTQQDAVDCASQALEKYNIGGHYVLIVFDKVQPNMHCIVGRNFDRM